jgi:hypothetical protein
MSKCGNGITRPACFASASIFAAALPSQIGCAGTMETVL